jgi:hypothetical protein
MKGIVRLSESLRAIPIHCMLKPTQGAPIAVATVQSVELVNCGPRNVSHIKIIVEPH